MKNPPKRNHRGKDPNHVTTSGKRSVGVGKSVSDSAIITGHAEVVVVNSNINGDVVGRDKIIQIQSAPIPTTTSLHQLRPPVGDFVGRKQEIEVLIGALHSRRTCISGINGMGGIGKTELALVVAEYLVGEYPDAQFFINLQGTSPQARRPSDILANLIRAFVGTEVNLPDSLDQLEQIYRSQLSGKRVLILLDNAADAEQVRPLLPPASCATLITSRQKISLPAMTPITLNPLAPAEARELLSEIVPRTQVVADEICRLCGYLPLAIRAAGSLLATNADLDPAEYLVQLEDERSRLKRIGTEGVETGVEASFNLSYADLDSATARVFRELAIFPATFDSVAEESVCADDGHACLSDLVRRSLVLYDPGTRRYRLHDLARLLAAKRLGKQREIVAERHSSYYVKVLEKADDLYDEGGEAMDRGLALFDLEWANISAGQAWAAQHSNRNPTARSLCISYVDAGTYVLMLRQDSREAMLWAKRALGAARRSNSRKSELRILNHLGRCQSRLANEHQAVLSYKKALEIADDLGDIHWKAALIGNLADAYRSLGNIDRALEYLRESLAIFRSVGDRRNEGFALGSLAACYTDIGEINRSRKLYEEELTIAREIGDRYQQIGTLGSLGYLACRRGEYAKAIELNDQALTIAREIGASRSESDALSGMGYAYMEMGESERAIEFYEQALLIARTTGDPGAEGDLLNSIGAAYWYLKDHGRAIEFLEKSLAIQREIVSPHAEVSALLNLGHVYSDLCEGTHVEELYGRALRIAREIGDFNGQAVALNSLGSERASLGENKRAVELKEHALALYRQVGDERQEGKVLFELSIVLNRMGRRALAIEYAKQSLRIRERIQDPKAANVRSQLSAWGEG